jgi:hypothetical protein
MTPEPYRIVEPQTFTDAELRAILNPRPSLLAVTLKFAAWCSLLYITVIAILIIW